MTCGFLIELAPVVQRLDNTIHWINHYPVDSVVCFVRLYRADSVIQHLNNRVLLFTSGHQSVTPFLSGAPLDPKKILVPPLTQQGFNAVMIVRLPWYNCIAS